jgi:hypothetical protein
MMNKKKGKNKQRRKWKRKKMISNRGRVAQWKFDIGHFVPLHNTDTATGL